MVRWCDSGEPSALWTTQVTLKTSRGRRGAFRDAVQTCEFNGIEVPAIDRILKMVLRFRQRSACDVEESCKVRMGSSSEAFGNVARGGRGGVTDLIVEPEISFHLRLV